jgi:hypothetical protein
MAFRYFDTLGQSKRIGCWGSLAAFGLLTKEPTALFIDQVGMLSRWHLRFVNLAFAMAVLLTAVAAGEFLPF